MDVGVEGGAKAGSSAADERRLSEASPPADCAGFEYSELATATHGPFGPLGGRENLLRENGFSRPSLPIFTAISCCFAADISFPTAWYDFASTDWDFSRLTDTSARRFPWDLKRERAFFRGSMYWYEAHGRTRAFALSMASPELLDADWCAAVPRRNQCSATCCSSRMTSCVHPAVLLRYEDIDMKYVETDGQNVFGDIATHARYKYLLSLEGHSYWSFRIRQLLHLNSVVLHQDLPCHEFWHALLRPYEHYLPISRDLADLRAQLRYVRAHDAAARRMVGRMQRLARLLLSQRAVLGYVRSLLGRYAALQMFEVRRHPEAVLLDEIEF